MLDITEKDRITKLFEQGDILGLEEINDILDNKEEVDIELLNLLHFVMHLNYYVFIGETETGIFADNYIDIHELYLKMLNLLFEKLEIVVE